MKVLVLSCSTGGGHNACAHNIVEGLIKNNIEADFQNYLELFEPKVQERVEEFYYKSLIGNGHLFEGIYKLGELYNKTKLVSPVYLLNKYGKDKLNELIQAKDYNLCICTHLYPALALTELKKERKIPFLFVGTDYKCIPFTNEVNPDYFIIPAEPLREEYIKMEIPEEKLIPLGIPVSFQNFRRENLIQSLNITHQKNILLISGSMGFGHISKIVENLLKSIDKNTALHVVCGHNQKLYEELCLIKKEQLKVYGFIHNVSEYIFISDLVITKPGGLTTTEAAVLRKPILHICPIPGVETYNADYFSKNGMSILETDIKKIPEKTIMLLNDQNLRKSIMHNLEKINKNSLQDLCDFIKENYEGKEENK